MSHAEDWARNRSYGSQDPSAEYSLEQFEATKELGSGSFGVVKEVVERRTGAKFAMKILDKRKVVDQGLQTQIKREVGTQLRVVHPNVVRMHYYFEDASNIYCLLELADGGQLFRYLREHQDGISEARAASFFADVAKGLSYLHGLDVVHRDLKPENILLFGKEMVAKIADLGWCAEITAEGPGRNTFCGTMDYVAPEMLLNEPHDEAVDLWALGVLLYEMLVGRAPFAAKSPKESVERICAANVDIPGGVSAGPAELIRGLLQSRKRSRLTLPEVLTHAWIYHLVVTSPLPVRPKSGGGIDSTTYIQRPKRATAGGGYEAAAAIGAASQSVPASRGLEDTTLVQRSRAPAVKVAAPGSAPAKLQQQGLEATVVVQRRQPVAAGIGGPQSGNDVGLDATVVAKRRSPAMGVDTAAAASARVAPKAPARGAFAEDGGLDATVIAQRHKRTEPLKGVSSSWSSEEEEAEIAPRPKPDFKAWSKAGEGEKRTSIDDELLSVVEDNRVELGDLDRFMRFTDRNGKRLH